MDPVSIVFLIALGTAPAGNGPVDIDARSKAALVDIDSPYMNAKVLSAMSLPYKYGVTQMPCKAKEWQPQRGWKAAREPSGRIQWVSGPATKVFWSGIYGTCLIQSQVARDAMDEIQRTALECECNGWTPSD
jgi:hypothetical protein